MDYAPIVPPQGLGLFFKYEYTSHMALAQYILDDPRYAEWYGRERFQAPKSHLIVDNGIAEGVSLPFREVVEAAEYVRADEVVMPDVMRDARETIRSTLDQHSMSLVPEENRMLVPQGDDWMSWTYCLSIFTDPQTIRARSIGIAKHLESLPGGRPHALQIIKDRGVDKRYEIHLLGVWRQPFAEVRRAAEVLPTIRSIDTGAPVAYAQRTQALNDIKHYSLSWDAPILIELAHENLTRYKEFCNGSKAPSRKV